MAIFYDYLFIRKKEIRCIMNMDPADLKAHTAQIEEMHKKENKINLNLISP